jgi:hypothetical protein
VLPVGTLTVPTPPLSVADHRHLYPSSPEPRDRAHISASTSASLPTRTCTLPPRRPQPPPTTAPARPHSRPHRRRCCASPARSRPRAPSSGSTATAPRAAASSRPSLARRSLCPSAPKVLFLCAILVTARRACCSIIRSTTRWTRDGIRVAFSSLRSWVRGLMLRYAHYTALHYTLESLILPARVPDVLHAYCYTLHCTHIAIHCIARILLYTALHAICYTSHCTQMAIHALHANGYTLHCTQMAIHCTALRCTRRNHSGASITNKRRSSRAATARRASWSRSRKSTSTRRRAPPRRPSARSRS